MKALAQGVEMETLLIRIVSGIEGAGA